MTYHCKIHSLIIKPEGEPIFSEQATIIGIEDEAAGVFFTIEQDGGKVSNHSQKVSFESAEWPHIVDAVERLRAEWVESV